MADQRLKLLYLLKILLNDTDENHGISLAEIQHKLMLHDIPADRKTLYTDFDQLDKFGYEVIKWKEGHTTYYAIPEREFELSELKLLTDAVQAAKFITVRKSNALIKKLEALTSSHNARQLNRQVLIAGRVKSMNESIYYSVDAIHEAINDDLQIRFQYFNWTPDKKTELRHDGEFYEISPWALVWDDEYYYMIGYDSKAGKIKHFRVDKMQKISTTNHARRGQEFFHKNDVQMYSKSLFHMTGGTNERVSFVCENSYAGIIIDRFGKDVHMLRTDDEHFEVSVDVSVSPQFFGWVFGLGEKIRLTAPENVVADFKDYVKKVASLYE